MWKYFLRPKKPVVNHFEKLHEWLQHREEMQTERVSGIHRYNLYGVKKGKNIEAQPWTEPCTCMPLCECTWTDSSYRKPWILACLLEHGLVTKTADEPDSIGCKCMAPCKCRWTERDTRPPWTLKILSATPKNEFLDENSQNEDKIKQKNSQQRLLKKGPHKSLKPIIHKKKSGTNDFSNTNDSAKRTKVIFVKVPCECASSSLCVCTCNKQK